VLGTARYAIEAISALACSERNPMTHQFAAILIDRIEEDR